MYFIWKSSCNTSKI